MKTDSIPAPHDNREKLLSKQLLTALIPAAIWAISLFTIGRLMKESISLLYFFMDSIIITGMAAFFVNLFFPYSTSKTKAIVFGLPTAIAFLIIFAVIPFFAVDPGNFIEDIGFHLIAICYFYFPASIILLISVGLVSWLGARLKAK